MRQIARDAGLQQSSIYYYFSSRDDVLETVVTEANRLSLDHLRRLLVEPAPPSLQLYRIVRFDVLVLRGLAYDINEIGRLGASDDERFGQFWWTAARRLDLPSRAGPGRSGAEQR